VVPRQLASDAARGGSDFEARDLDSFQVYYASCMWMSMGHYIHPSYYSALVVEGQQSWEQFNVMGGVWAVLVIMVRVCGCPLVSTHSTLHSWIWGVSIYILQSKSIGVWGRRLKGGKCYPRDCPRVHGVF
jgi:hypothetical protein